MSRGESHTDSSKRIVNKKLRALATCSKERSFRAAQPPEANSRGRHLVSRAANAYFFLSSSVGEATSHSFELGPLGYCLLFSFFVCFLVDFLIVFHSAQKLSLKMNLSK